jgi:RNA polymerase sigma-70 factor (ECF subfamily)
MLRLPEEQRTLLALRFVAGLTSDEIGQALGKPAGTVRYQIAQARRRLAQELGMLELSLEVTEL